MMFCEHPRTRLSVFNYSLHKPGKPPSHSIKYFHLHAPTWHHLRISHQHSFQRILRSSNLQQKYEERRVHLHNAWAKDICQRERHSVFNEQALHRTDCATDIRGPEGAAAAREAHKRGIDPPERGGRDDVSKRAVEEVEVVPVDVRVHLQHKIQGQQAANDAAVSMEHVLWQIAHRQSSTSRRPCA